MDATPSLEWSELCLDSLTLLAIRVPVASDLAVNTRSVPYTLFVQWTMLAI